MASRTDPYEFVRSWWGEELDAALVKRIAGAPSDQIEEFQNYWYTVKLDDNWLPELEAGKLRPVFSIGTMDRIEGRNRVDEIPKQAVPILLYAHEVVLNDVTPRLWAPDRQVREEAASWLLDVRPLFDAGALHFRVVDSRKRHPSAATLVSGLIDDALVTENRDLDELISRVAAQFPQDDLAGQVKEILIRSLLEDVTTFYTVFERLWPGRVHRLLRSNAKYSMLRWLFSVSDAGRRERPDINLLHLARMAVPQLAHKQVRELVNIRQSEEHFAELRAHLRRGLERIHLSDLAEPMELDAARSTLAEELEPLTRRLKKVVHKSPTMEAMRMGFSSFAIASLGAVAGTAVGGSLASATASAAVAKTGESLLSYIRAYKERKLASDTLELVTTYIEPQAS